MQATTIGLDMAEQLFFAVGAVGCRHSGIKSGVGVGQPLRASVGEIGQGAFFEGFGCVVVAGHRALGIAGRRPTQGRPPAEKRIFLLNAEPGFVVLILVLQLDEANPRVGLVHGPIREPHLAGGSRFATRGIRPAAMYPRQAVSSNGPWE